MPLPRSVAIIGAGPAGLAAAYALARAGVRPVVLEMEQHVGGLSRTQAHKGYLFDVGGHRFYTRSREIQALWEGILGEEFLTVRRMSRIYYAGRFFDYPLRPWNTLERLGALESARVIASYLRTRKHPRRSPANLEEWTVARFGRRLYEIFFKTYSEKVWGIPCTRIDADWADLRIGNLTLRGALRNAFFGRGGSKTLISAFHYPRLGPGMVWTRMREAIEAAGGEVRLGCEVVALAREGGCVRSLVCRTRTGLESLACEHVISSMPLAHLVLRLDPPAPEEALRAARALRYRAFIMVALIIDRPDLFPDNWIYVHAPEVRVGRIQNFRNWSADLVPDPSRSSIGMEYFCDEGDELWNLPDAELIDLAGRELARLGLAAGARVVEGIVVREKQAYPLYERGFQPHVAALRQYVGSLENVQTIGRNGMHRYNNQDHSMLAGLMAAKNILGGAHDLWSVDPDALERESAHEAAAAR